MKEYGERERGDEIRKERVRLGGGERSQEEERAGKLGIGEEEVGTRRGWERRKRDRREGSTL